MYSEAYNMLKYIITSMTKRKLLQVFLLNPESKYYIRELEKILREPVTAVRRELANLQKVGLLKITKVGILKYYQVNTSCQLYKPLKEIIELTMGFEITLKEALSIYKSIEVAFIYGSFARGEGGEKSDIDLMIIGDVDEVIFHEEVSGLEDELKREVNYTIMPSVEFKKKLYEGDVFINRIIKDKKIVLKGNLNEI